MDITQEHDGLNLSFPATEAEASTGIAALAAQLAFLGLPADRAGEVRIALAEAINNVIEHAYAGIEPARVRVDCQLRRDLLEIQISDTGNPLPGYRLPGGIPANIGTTLQDLPEGGFGWYLIRQLANDIRYEHREGHNLLSLRFDLPEAGQT